MHAYRQRTSITSRQANKNKEINTEPTATCACWIFEYLEFHFPENEASGMLEYARQEQRKKQGMIPLFWKERKAAEKTGRRFWVGMKRV
jgi:hypothetical protein